MTATPLTHHEILGLAEPFTRRGRRIDLAASDRLERRLVFRPAASADTAGPAAGECRESLTLESFGTGTFQLTRTITRADGLQATLQAKGAQPVALLAQIERVAPAQHFRSAGGCSVARSYSWHWVDDLASAGPPAPPLLSRGEVKVEGLTLVLSLSGVRGVSADITLSPNAGERLDLPEDLLAVLGWDWARLIAEPAGWKTKLRLRGTPARRSASAEAALETATEHLAQVLAEPPARFHERHLWARWGVVLRRSIPSLTALGMIVGVAFLPRMAFDQVPGLFMLLHYAPIALLALAFCLQELPRFEIPPLPRRPHAARWRQAAAPAGVGG